VRESKRRRLEYERALAEHHGHIDVDI
jgi:hypothetical protein